MLTVISSLLLLCLTIPDARATRYDCHWVGTAPLCGQPDCVDGYTQLAVSTTATDTEAFGEFGSPCVSYPGKSLCCRDDHAAMIKEHYNWIGFSPVCSNMQCRAGFEELIRSRFTHDLIVETPFAGFGSTCVTGTKALCCKHSENPEWEKSCEWIGTSPVCGTSECPPGKTELARSKYLPDNLYADFGSACIFGEKTLCCNSV